MQLDPERLHLNGLDDPPCSCGRDLGDTGNSPRYAPNTSGIAVPLNFTSVAVKAPADTVVRLRVSSGKPVARIALRKDDFHVMSGMLGGGGAFRLPADALGSDDLGQVGSFYVTDHLDIAEDPRAILLQHFWKGQGFDVEPFAVRRSKEGAYVRGQIELVLLTGRWFHGGNVYANLGRCYVVEEAGGLRFLKPGDFTNEFAKLTLPNGETIEL